MCVSASKTAADSLSKFVKRLIDEMPMLQHLRPRDGQNDSVIMFDVGPARASKDPSFKSVGITGQITGSRSDEIIADDIETTNNSLTHQARECLLEFNKEFAAVSKPETGYITYLGTPQSEASIYNELPGRGYEIRIWPARIPTNPDKYERRLAPFILNLIAKGAQPLAPVSPRFLAVTFETDLTVAPRTDRALALRDTAVRLQDVPGGAHQWAVNGSRLLTPKAS